MISSRGMQSKTEEAVNELNGGLFTAGGLLAGVAGAVADVVCRRVGRAAADLMRTHHITPRARMISSTLERPRLCTHILIKPRQGNELACLRGVDLRHKCQRGARGSATIT